MRKRKNQTKLSRTTAHRNALLRNLAQELILHKKIKTTTPKAKALRPFVESLITHAKNNKKSARPYLSAVFYDQSIVEELLTTVGPAMAETKKNGGYTRIIKLGARKGDSAEESIIQLIMEEQTKKEDHATK